MVTDLVEVVELHSELQLLLRHQGQVGLARHSLHKLLHLRPARIWQTGGYEGHVLVFVVGAHETLVYTVCTVAGWPRLTQPSQTPASQTSRATVSVHAWGCGGRDGRDD